MGTRTVRKITLVVPCVTAGEVLLLSIPLLFDQHVSRYG